MGVKAIIDVDVNDQQFVKFRELFEKYTTALAKTPTDWKNATDEQRVANSLLESMAKRLEDAADAERDNSDADEKRVKNLVTSEKLWTGISRSAAYTAKSILDIGAGILKWGGILGGAAIGGSLFGIDKLAGSISEGRRSAMGLGTTIGEQSAFNLDFGRAVDPNFLSMVNEMKSDPGKAWSLATMGVGTGGSTADTSLALLKAMFRRAHETPDSQLGMLSSITGLSVGTDTWKRLKGMGSAEFNAQMGAYASDKKSLDPSNPQGWQNLDTMFGRSWGRIKNALGNTLGSPGMLKAEGKLSDAVATALTRFLESPGVAKGLDQFTVWLNSLTTSLNGDWMKSKIDAFGTSIGELGDLIHNLAHPIDAIGAKFDNPVAQWVSRLFDSGKPGNSTDYQAYLGKMDWMHGLPPGLLEHVWQAESGGTLHPKDSAKGAMGPFQFLSGTAKEFGIDPNDPEQAASGAARKLRGELEKYSGDVAKTLAAYNWGEGNLDKDLAAHPKDWGAYAPKETQDFVRKVAGINITVTNQTGGSANVSVNSLQGGQ